MSYSYESAKPWLFTDQGQRAFIKARDNAFRLLDAAGAFMSFRIFAGVDYPDTDCALAILDRMVELGDVLEVTTAKAWGQHRVFMRPLNG